ncbi:MAG: excisionase family DNA-binding protein [Actinobacteria bacterium]|nr:excisionase family DNA-binding protein [Actinomycetota bacterium]
MNIASDRRPLLDVAGAAEYLTTSEHFVRRLVRERRVAVIRLGRHVRLSPDDLDAYVTAGRSAAIR